MEPGRLSWLIGTWKSPSVGDLPPKEDGGNWSDELLDQIEIERVAAFDRLVNERGMAFRPGVARILREAETDGCRVAVITCQAPSSLSVSLETLLGESWPRHISAVASGDGTRLSEVTSEMYMQLLHNLYLSARTAVALEATSQGVRAATSLGIWTVAVPTFWSEGQDFSDAGLMLPHLGEVSSPLMNVVGIKELNAGIITVPAITRLRKWVALRSKAMLTVPLRSSVHRN